MNHQIKRLAGTLLLLLGIVSAVYAQNGANYAFTTGSDASLVADLNGNTIDMSVGTSSQIPFYGIPIGFSTVIMGTRVSHFAFSQNGLIAFGTGIFGPTSSSSAPSMPYNDYGGPVLSAYCASTMLGTGGVIRYKTVGIAPNRTLVIEYNGLSVFSSTAGGSQDATYQVRLYEGDGIVEYVYGNFSVSGLSAAGIQPTIGISSSSTAFTSVHLANQTVNTTGVIYKNPVPGLGAETVLNSTADGSRRYFRFAPVMPDEATSVNVSNIAAQSLTVSWTPPADLSHFLAYVLYKSTDGINYTYVGQYPKTQTSYTMGVDFNTTVYWKLRTLSEGRESAGITTSATTLNPSRPVLNGNWSDPAVWNTGVVPSCTDDVYILNGRTVNVNSIATAKNITIDSTGVLAISPGAALTAGCTGNNYTVWNKGTMNVSGGTFNINGNLALENKSRLLQSGGEIIIDGNDNGNIATSVPTTVPLLGLGRPGALFNGGTSVGGSYISNIITTGGKITIVDPHAAADSAFAFAAFIGGALDLFGLDHTMQFGNGISTDPSASGAFNLRIVSDRTRCAVFGKVLVDAGSAPNRVLKRLYANGDVSMISGIWDASGSVLGGNIDVSGGTLVSGGLALCKSKTSMIGYGGDATMLVTQTIPQQISTTAPGIIVDKLVSPTANFGGLTISNTSATGITINTLNSVPGTITADASISGNMQLSGKINMAPGSTFFFLRQDTAQAGSVLAITYANSGFLPGITVARSYYNTIGNQPNFAIGSNTPSTLNFSQFPFVTASGEERIVWLRRTGSVTPGVYAVTYNDIPGTTPVSFVDDNKTLNTRSNSYWTFSNLGTNPTAGDIWIAIRAPNVIPGVIAPAATHIVRANSTIGGYATASITPLYGIRYGLTGADLAGAPLYMGISGTVPLPVTLEYFKGEKKESVNLLRWKTSAETNFSHFELQRSANGTDFNVLATVEPHTPKGSEYTYVDEAPFAARNFYRLNMVDLDGKSELSATVELSGDLKNNLKIEIGPVPVVQHLKIKIEGARSGNGIVRVVDMSGKALMSMVIAADVTEADLDLSKLVSGVYTFEYTDGNNNYNRKITKL